MVRNVATAGTTSRACPLCSTARLRYCSARTPLRGIVNQAKPTRAQQLHKASGGATSASWCWQHRDTGEVPPPLAESGLQSRPAKHPLIITSVMRYPR